MPNEISTLYEALDAQNGIYLVRSGEGIGVLAVQHDHVDTARITRYPLGTAIEVGDLLRLLSDIGGATVPAVMTEVQPEVLRLPDTSLTCELCGARYVRKDALRMHKMRKHAPAVPALPVASFTCEICSKTFGTAHGLTTHNARVHKRGAWSTRKSEPELEPPATDDPGDAPLVPDEDACEICGEPWETHLRCSGCEVGIGPNHAVRTVHSMVNGQPLCADCVHARTLRKSLVHAHAARQEEGEP